MQVTKNSIETTAGPTDWFTGAVYVDTLATPSALSRMQAEAERSGAVGIVGARVDESSHGWDSHVIEYFAIGTAIAEVSGDQ